MSSSSLSTHLPLGVLSDSYKASHFLMYPDATRMVAYGEFRCPFQKDTSDTRLVFYGLKYIIDQFVAVPWTLEDVERLDDFYKTHNAGHTPFPFPKELFVSFVKENRGYFPVRIEALREGTVVNARTPVFQIFAEGKYSRLVTFLETILTQVWYPSTVATLSRRVKSLIGEAFEKSVDAECHHLLDSRLHDFGFRGCTSVEQSVIGGVAHLLNFTGSDTMSAAYYAQYTLNRGKPVAQSIPASEHSVMTAWPTEEEAVRNMVQQFGEGTFSVVADSYDYDYALTEVFPNLADEHKAKGGYMIVRPDSGDPVQCVLTALREGEKTYGCRVNALGFKVIPCMGVIQGDGINANTIRAILEEVMAQGYSAQNVAFGMGGGLLQKVNRDTMSFATKLSFIRYDKDRARDVMKHPQTDSSKCSLPGILRVQREDDVLTVYPRSEDDKDSGGELRVVYDHGPVKDADGEAETFDDIRARVEAQWKATPKLHDPLSEALKQKIWDTLSL